MPTDDDLAAELIAWAERIGNVADELERLRADIEAKLGEDDAGQ